MQIASTATPDLENPHRLFLDHLGLIDRAIESVSRKLRPEERDEFASWAKEKLLDNDGAILRKCRDWQRPRTFLAVVVANLCKDFLNHLRGKYRPSKEAERLGDLAVLLERLQVRDGYSFAEACEILRTNFKVKESVAELADLAGRLPGRTGRHLEGDEALQHQVSHEETPDERLHAAQRQILRRQVFEALTRALAELPAEDQLLLRFHFVEGRTWADVARSLRLEQKPLYGRVDKILAGLKRALAEEGFGADALREVLQGAGLAFWFRERRKDRGGPSRL